MNASPIRNPLCRVLAALLDYPGENFALVLNEAETFLCCEPAPRPVCDQILSVVRWMRRQDPTALQETYVQTFDLTPRNALHLTAHLLEEQDRRRGPALIRLAEYYRAAGLCITAGELPDYLPAILEFASMLEPQAAAGFLAEAEEALDVLEGNLRSAGSPYALLVDAARRAAPSSDATPAVAAGAAP